MTPWGNTKHFSSAPAVAVKVFDAPAKSVRFSETYSGEKTMASFSWFLIEISMRAVVHEYTRARDFMQAILSLIHAMRDVTGSQCTYDIQFRKSLFFSGERSSKNCVRSLVFDSFREEREKNLVNLAPFGGARVLSARSPPHFPRVNR